MNDYGINISFSLPWYLQFIIRLYQNTSAKNDCITKGYITNLRPYTYHQLGLMSLNEKPHQKREARW